MDFQLLGSGPLSVSSDASPDGPWSSRGPFEEPCRMLEVSKKKHSLIKECVGGKLNFPRIESLVY
jgi:hypothetical protein